MSRFQDMQAFVAVVEAGSFTAAAERLDMAKSAVSRRVSGLEQRLGASLLRRTTRRLSLTGSGRAYYERAVRILADLDEAEAAVAHEQGELRGNLRIALPLSFGVMHMCEPIAEFRREHPAINFDLDLNDRRVDLVEEGADLAVRIGKLTDSTLIAKRIFTSRTVVCASPDYLAAHGRPDTPESLADHDCLVYANNPDPSRWVCVDRGGNRRETEVRVAMKASSGDFLTSMASNSIGIALQPTFIAGNAIRNGDLVPILTDYEWPTTPAWALYPPARHMSSRVRAFIDFIAGYFAGTPYWDLDCEAHIRGL